MRPPSIKETLRVVHDVISYIVDNLSGTVRMSEAATIAGMKQSAFSRFFKKNTGANFVDCSRILRIGRACKLLSDTGRPVTDICFEVGYANISNFNRHFRKERGVTPSQYKRLSNLRAAPVSLPAWGSHWSRDLSYASRLIRGGGGVRLMSQAAYL